MTLSLIVAAAANHVIGRNNRLPWYLPDDLKYFKSMTFGKPVIMGRKTFDTIGKPLPGRHNIVLSRQQNYQADHVYPANSLTAAIALAQSFNLINGVDESMVIGGGKIYTAALPLAARIYLTRIHHHILGDAYFPKLQPDKWQEVSRQDVAATEINPYDVSYIVLERCPS